MTAPLTHNQILVLWHRVCVESIRRNLPELTLRQFAMMLHIYLEPPPHTVRGLASVLSISKPAVTRAIDRLSGLDFVRRKVDESDRRSVLLLRTVKGSVFLREFGDFGSDLSGELPE
jgi:DNA-binding MarR family transcriptional regulator